MFFFLLIYKKTSLTQNQGFLQLKGKQSLNCHYTTKHRHQEKGLRRHGAPEAKKEQNSQ